MISHLSGKWLYSYDMTIFLMSQILLPIAYIFRYPYQRNITINTAIYMGFFGRKKYFFNKSAVMDKISERTYILIFHCQSPDKVVCSGLLRFLENKRQGEHLHNPRLKWTLEQNVRKARFQDPSVLTHIHSSNMTDVSTYTGDSEGAKTYGSLSKQREIALAFFLNRES